MMASDLAARTARATARMPQPQTRTIRLDDLGAARRLGERLAASLRSGDAVLLSGDLGAGKTELARAMIQARMGAEIDVPSPTFTLIQTYESPGLPIAHADLYRIERVEDLAELGLDEALETGALLVEWPERAEGLWPAARLEIALTHDGEGPARIAALTGHGEWASRIAQVTGAAN
jgi:tRNA threonylcarbamoyl adenosine modification protein YjeE